MTRFNCSILVATVICALFALPALARDPSVTKSVLTSEDGSSVVVVSVSAAERAVYGINISDASASLEDIAAPDGWVGIATDGMIMFRTMDNPIDAGKSLSFRIVTKNSQAPLGFVFRDKKTAFAAKQGI